MYDYLYTHKEGAKPGQNEMRTTDTGRPVYGGGGITPDVEVGERKLNRFQQSLARKYAFFNFAKRYLAEHKTIGQDFEVTPAVLDRFRQFLREEGIEFQEPELAENLDYVQQSIKLELSLSVFGMDEAYKLEAFADPQIQKAVELLPQAAAMLENARRAQLQKESR